MEKDYQVEKDDEQKRIRNRRNKKWRRSKWTKRKGGERGRGEKEDRVKQEYERLRTLYTIRKLVVWFSVMISYVLF